VGGRAGSVWQCGSEAACTVVRHCAAVRAAVVVHVVMCVCLCLLIILFVFNLLSKV
jgi:hypothetical protein